MSDPSVPDGESGASALRIDRWLWAARLYRTRSLAAAAVQGGKVQVDGRRVKASRPVGAGARVHIRRGGEELEVVVRAVCARRGPASTAARLYEETAASVLRRGEAAAQRRAAARPSRPRGAGRPTKRERRRITRLRGR